MPLPSEKQWALRLFFSVDLIDSTQYKAKRYSEKDPDWTFPFETFYSTFPEDFVGRFSQLVMERYPDEKLAEDENPQPWKFMGDEILLHATVRNSKLIPLYLEAFRDVLRKKCKDIGDDNPLRCKGCIWSAGFPVTNREVMPGKRGASGKEGMVDFIGPSMDCGFRLSKFATERKLVVSVEVALMAARHCAGSSNDTSPTFFFDGRECLKGVLFDNPYPILWIDTTPNSSRRKEYPEDVLENRKNVKIRDLHAFCKSFIANNNPHLIIPFVCEDRCKEFADIPPDHQQQYSNIVSFVETRDEIHQSTVDSLKPEEKQQTGNAKKSADTRAIHKRVASYLINATKSKNEDLIMQLLLGKAKKPKI